MSEIDSTAFETGKVISKTVETSVSEDGTTTVTEETTIVEVNGDHVDETKTDDVETNGADVKELKPSAVIEVKAPAEENGQVTKDEAQTTETEQTAPETEESAAPAVAVSGGEVDAIVEEKKEESPPKVILHQFPPGKNVPSLSSFCLKIETFLRINKIPYENQYGYKFGKKGKLPWIEYKGERKCDTNTIIQFLNEKFDVNMDTDFSSEQCALGRAVKVMIEESTYWAMTYSRFIDNFNEFKKFMAPASGGGIGFSVGMKMQQRKVRSNLDGHGMGRHSQEEIYQIAKEDITAVSELLGEKEFILGDKPSSYDCTLFGFFANVISGGLESPLKAHIQENAKNLLSYCERVKDLCWQDWSDMILGEKPEPSLKKGFSFRKKKTKAPKVAKEADKTEETADKPDEEAKPAEGSNADENVAAEEASKAAPIEEADEKEKTQE